LILAGYQFPHGWQLLLPLILLSSCWHTQVNENHARCWESC
jgi:hypothetical protein